MRARPRLFLFALAMTVTAMATGADGQSRTSGHPTFSAALNGADVDFEIVRCHFAEGRLVLRRAGELVVLRQGRRLDGTGIRAIEISPRSAVLLESPTSTTGGMRLLIVSQSDSGELELKEFSSDPLMTGDPTTAVKVRSSQANRPAPPPRDD